MNRYKNILIVRTDRLGDVILTTPSIKALKLAWPQARFSILVSPVTQELIQNNPYLDEILVDDRKGVHRGLFGFLKLVVLLRRKKFDLAIVYHTKKRTNLLCFLAGIGRRVGYRNNKFGFLLTDPIVDERHYGRKHEAQYCLDVLSYLGVAPQGIVIKNPDDLREDLYVAITSQARDWVDQFFRDNQISDGDLPIVIHPSASDTDKQWPTIQFIDLMRQLSSRYHVKILIVGTAHAFCVAEEIIRQVGALVIDLTGKTTLAQLAALLQRCRLLISNDSGPVHVGVGVGIPVVSIFTRNQPGINPQRWSPLGKNSRTVSVRPQEVNTLATCPSSAIESPEFIPTESVLEAVDDIFKLC